jgi:hypothetical protein
MASEPGEVLIVRIVGGGSYDHRLRPKGRMLFLRRSSDEVRSRANDDYGVRVCVSRRRTRRA